MARDRDDDELIGSDGRVEVWGQTLSGRCIVTIAPTNAAPRDEVEMDSARLGVGFKPAVMQRVPEDLKVIIAAWLDAV